MKNFVTEAYDHESQRIAGPTIEASSWADAHVKAQLLGVRLVGELG